MADSSKEVLIVDDSPNMRAALRLFLENTAHLHVCGEAADGTEAIEKARQKKPGLIVMDVAMPNMNGIEAASVIRGSLPTARIVVFTFHADALLKTHGRFAGIDLVLSKEEGAAGLTAALDVLLPDLDRRESH